MPATVRLLHTLCVLVGVAVSAWLAPPVTPSTAFEAAFQGSCKEKNPCDQLCYDLHDGTFECGCKEGLVLSKNGYSCSNAASEEEGFESDASPDSDYQNIDSKVVDGRQVSVPEILSRTRDHPIPVLSTYGHHPNDVISSHYNSHREVGGGKKTEKPQVPTTMQPSDDFLSVITSGSSCANIDCGDGGQCVADTVAGSHCLCSLGYSGPTCLNVNEARLPRFSGQSYLTFPPLRNAFRNSQVVLEFRPETLHGLLLYSGDKTEIDGDFMSLLLQNGYVEFRFDCGSGMASVRSAEPVVLHSWNRVVVYRHRWDAWLQLNGGLHSQGRAKGLLSRITFRQNLFVGGTMNINQVSERLKVNVRGFIGCMRHLEVNDHVYDFRPLPKGEAIGGLDIVECTNNACNTITCQNGGTCSSSDNDAAFCLCPLGYTGSRCEQFVDLVMPSFNSTSYLKYPGLGSSALSFIELSLVIKPTSLDGVFFYNGFKTDGTGDFLALSMSRGHVEFRFDLGTGPAIIRSREPVSLHEWHTVFISRTGRDGLLSVDRQPAVEGMAEGAFTQLSLPQNLYLGGVPDFDEVSRKLGQRDGFNGCIQQMMVNSRSIRIVDAALSGVNVDNCAHPCVNRPCTNKGTCAPRFDRFSCHCQLGYTDTRCETEVLDSISTPMFVGNSFLKFTQDEITKRIVGNKMIVELKLKAVAPDGLILWTGEQEMTPFSDFFAIGLKEGHVHVRFNLGGGEAYMVNNETRLDDGHWHRLRLVRTDQIASLHVDSDSLVTIIAPGALRQLNTNNGLYIGGMDDIQHLSLGKYTSGLVGCIAEVRLSTDFRVEFVTHASSGMNIEVCS